MLVIDYLFGFLLFGQYVNFGFFPSLIVSHYPNVHFFPEPSVKQSDNCVDDISTFQQNEKPLYLSRLK